MHPKNTLIEKTCEQCGKAFRVRPSEAHRRRYCSRPCQNAAAIKPRTILQSDLDRFWSKVDKLSSPHGCWLWTGASDKQGRGNFSVRTENGIGQITSARFSMWLVYGDAINGVEVCHDCPGGDNPACVNPDHLFLGTHRDNLQDMVRKGRQGKGHGLKGEELYQSVLTEVQVIEARQRYVDTDTPLWRMAKDYGITRKGLILAINGANWSHLPHPEPTILPDEAERIRQVRAFNQRPIRSKLTESDVRAIRKRFAAGGITCQALAREYGLSHTAMSKVLKRDTWKDVA